MALGMDRPGTGHVQAGMGTGLGERKGPGFVKRTANVEEKGEDTLPTTPTAQREGPEQNHDSVAHTYTCMHTLVPQTPSTVQLPSQMRVSSLR